MKGIIMIMAATTTTTGTVTDTATITTSSESLTLSSKKRPDTISIGRFFLRCICSAAFLIFFTSSVSIERAFAQAPENPANPFLSKRTQVSFSGSGSADFLPRNLDHSMPGPTPAPNCLRKTTQVGFQIQCIIDPEVKSATTCKGTLSFYGFNETRNVIGDVTELPTDTYTMKLRSPDDDIQGCQLSNLPPVSANMGNAILMPGCSLNAQGCVGEVTGSGANHALSSSASVTTAPAD
jgi:hypothetical protein